MVKLIEAENISLAWIKGSESIVAYGFRTKEKIKLHNLIVDIKSLDVDERFHKLYETHMDMKVFQRTLNIVSSDESFIPHPSYWRRLKGREEFKIDQITQVISRLKEQPHSTKLTLCVYTPTDFNKQYTPCILCAELRVEKQRLYMTVLTRSQDFGKKSYADYIGLSRILQRIGGGSGIQPGGMIVHTMTASIAFSDLTRVKTLIEFFQGKR